MQIKFKSAWVITAITFAVCLAGYLHIDASTQIPVHWNIDGEVDRTASPLAALLPVPLIQVAVLITFTLLKYFEPRKENLKKSAKAIGATATVTVVFLALIELGILLEALGYRVIEGNYIMVGVGLLLAVLGNYMSKIRSGFFIGIRTPWTLSNDKVWHKTHRVGSRLFVAAGILITLCSLFLPNVLALQVTVTAVFVSTLVPVVYSWWAWRIEKTSNEG
ncbi:SdpI family protein [Kordiimonas aestuarii]|uniref:SdpI family protein n=1 Tax=Kordiimonas aestuarii TaxID=1005925 RepID=UPI0021CF090D|nr:SdpI family protein [Kordiimonas aestuarii]